MSKSQAKTQTQFDQPQGMEHKTFLSCGLYDIDASSNIRRACPKLANHNIDPFELVISKVLTDNNKLHYQFVETISKEIKIVTLAHSILKFGQIHPITVICNDDPVRKYKSVAGQRRYIAVGLIESLIRLQEDSALYAKAIKLLQEVKSMYADSEGGSMELDFQPYVPSLEQTFEIKIQLVNLSSELAEDIAFEENDEMLTMSDLDWGYQFDQMLKKNNPATGSTYTLQDIAKKRKKHYQFVRGRAALPYLPAAWKEKLDDNAISIVKAIEKALECKRRKEFENSEIAELETQIDQNEDQASGHMVIEMPDDHVKEVGEDIDLANASVTLIDKTCDLSGAESIVDDDTDLAIAEADNMFDDAEKDDLEELEKAKKKTTRKVKGKDIRLSVRDILTLIIESPRENLERLKALGETINKTLEEVLELKEEDIKNFE
jgi:hypothetical protein